ncbi:MAG TPA: adenine deaminase C-terminal domain-containing protein [Thermodesulfobacteriota bacterium]|nr:adenine deaminase C-terminal domain-containing protein [Thermodesulfobacteriota bacterium]
MCPDTVFNNAIVFNPLTREFIKGQSLWVKDGIIGYVGPAFDFSKSEKTVSIDADGMVLLPGLIDGHTHTLSHRYGVEEFVKHIIRSGVTTVITETIELATIVGKDGIEYFAKGLEGQPIRLYYTVAPLCGLTPDEETIAPTHEEFVSILKDPKCLGIGEIYWGNMFLEGSQGDRVKKLVSTALEMGKVVEGHTAGAKGQKLQAYASLGISSCHEPITEQEVLERLRLGYWIMIREGGIRKELEGVKGIFKKKIDFRRLALATDGVDPEGLLGEGYLDASVRSLLKLGVPPKLAYQMVTINVAEHFHLDHVIGSLTPGKMADLLIIPSSNEFSPQLVMCDGRIIYQDGKSLAGPRNIFFPEAMFHTVRVKDYRFPPVPQKGKVRAMELVSRLVTQERIIDLEDPEESNDIMMVFVINRLGSGKAFMGLLKGFGLQRGAYGTTTTWDMPDMVVVGCDTQSMETVIGRLEEIGGGCAYAIGKEIVAEFSAPLCGVISLKPMERVRDEVRKLEESLRKNGVKWEKPILTVDTFGTPAIPSLRITNHGYVRLKDRKILSLEA